MTTDPSEYPSQCDVSAEELEALAKAFHDEEHGYGDSMEEWPPTDDLGNVYPIWYTLDDLDDSGFLYDERYNQYNPFAGNLEPRTRETWGCCNAPLSNWRTRYTEIRFCGRISNSYGDEAYEPVEYTYCPKHKGRDNLNTAEEQMQTGMYVKSVDHLYEKLSPWKKLVGWGTFESLMGESTYEYGVEYEERTFDFSEEPFVPDDADEDGVLDVKCGYPTQYGHRALHLFVAAMQTVQMMAVQPRILHEDREEGEGVMESKTIEAAQLTSPTENDPTQRYKTLETWSEHHLNLPLSRVIKDQPRLLEIGGVETDPEAEEEGPTDDDIVLEIAADTDAVETKDDTGTDPNAFGDDYTAESEKIIENANDD